MKWKFRKDFQAIPGVKLKYGNSGISTQISIANSSKDSELAKLKLQHQLFKPFEAGHEIKSAAIQSMTSDNLQELKLLLSTSSNAFEETTTLIKQKQQSADLLFKKLNKISNSLFSFLFKKKIVRLQAEMNLANEELHELKQQLDQCIIHLEIDTEDVYFDMFRNIRKSFELLKSSHKKWDVTSSRETNRISERTSATSTITRTTINLSENTLPILQTNDMCPCIHNINGGDLYLYPGFMIVYDSKSEFALIDYADITINYSSIRFIEVEEVPKDSMVVGQTWYKVNKDGTPDRRFTSNYQIPIVEYGEVFLKSISGLLEGYYFSNADYAKLFCKAVTDYSDALKQSKALLKQFQ